MTCTVTSETKRFPALEMVIRLFAGMTLVGILLLLVGVVSAFTLGGAGQIVGVGLAGFGAMMAGVSFVARLRGLRLLARMTADPGSSA